MLITNVQALEILDSRGKPTVRAFITLEDGSVHAASVPSGASTGTHEALELRDNDNRYLGFGVQKAVDNIHTVIRPALVGLSTLEPDTVDTALLSLDGSENKNKLGANAILAVSMAVVRAAAHASEQPLWKFIHEYYFSHLSPAFPRLMVNVVNGGAHANWNFDVQEFMICPLPTAPKDSVRMASEVFLTLGKFLKEKGLSTLVGDEGGYSPALHSNEEVLAAIVEAAKRAGYTNKEHYQLALDCAATEWYKDGRYNLPKSKANYTAQELAQYYTQLMQQYSLFSFEDPFAEDDWEAFSAFTALHGQTATMVVGDDLFVTNPKRLEMGIEQKAANAILVKLNQIGSVSETVKAINTARSAGFKIIISHRSGETEDNFIADLAYGSGADFIKTGSMSRSDRLSKYNRLLEIEALESNT